jgi:CHAD domain-containing protein
MTSSGPGPGSNPDEHEVEWQFDALDLRPVERWLAALPLAPSPDGLPPLTGLAKPGRRLVDRYLDTDDWRIGRAGFVLRVRRRGRRDEVTLKDRGAATEGGLRTRLEVTEPLGPGGVDDLGPDGPVGRRVRAVQGRRDLSVVLEVRTRRRPYSLRVGGQEVAEVALDDTAIAVGDGQRPAQLKRVEVELDPAWVERLAPVVARLQEDCGLRPAVLSKFEAGLLAAGLTVPGPPDLGPADAGPGATLGQLAWAVLRRHLAVLLAREPGTRLGEDIEELHDMRVATRRLRAAFQIFAPVLPVRARPLAEELRWLAGVLGEVRDLDVQLADMSGPEWVALGPSGPGPVDELRALLRAERDEARGHLLAALDSDRWEALASGLTTLATAGPSRRSVAARRPAEEAVPDLVGQRHRAATKSLRRARRSGVADDYHRLRIRGKRLRYAMEFTADLYEGRTGGFIRRLARLQDRLGLMQDAEVAADRLALLATTKDLAPATVFAMGGAAERYRRESEELLATMPRHLAVLRGRHWEEAAGLMARRQAQSRAAHPAPAAPRPAPPDPATAAAPAPTPAPGPGPAGPEPDGATAPAAAPSTPRPGPLVPARPPEPGPPPEPTARPVPATAPAPPAVIRQLPPPVAPAPSSAPVAPGAAPDARP